MLGYRAMGAGPGPEWCAMDPAVLVAGSDPAGMAGYPQQWWIGGSPASGRGPMGSIVAGPLADGNSGTCLDRGGGGHFGVGIPAEGQGIIANAAPVECALDSCFGGFGSSGRHPDGGGSSGRVSVGRWLIGIDRTTRHPGRAGIGRNEGSKEFSAISNRGTGLLHGDAAGHGVAVSGPLVRAGRSGCFAGDDSSPASLHLVWLVDRWPQNGRTIVSLHPGLVDICRSTVRLAHPAP